MREIILDTETTGLDPRQGDRIIEIGCLEIINLKATGRSFQYYIDPERSVSEKTIEITGITDAMLEGMPKFKDIADEFLAFIGNDPLVIHNADFDMGFLNAELTRIGRAALSGNKVVDTLAIARRKFPGAPASLDALCRRFGIDNSSRDKHGALLDSELLADVYLELMGGRQPGLVFQAKPNGARDDQNSGNADRHPQVRRASALPSRITPEEEAAHATFLDGLPVSAMWRH